MQELIIDIETTLSHDHLHCVGVVDPRDRSGTLYVPDYNLDVMPGLKPLSELPTPEDYLWVAHNGVSFDFPKLAELADFHIPQENWIDTLLLSKMHDCNIQGGHSLENLARCAKAKQLKTDFDKADFDGPFTKKMGHYCLDDNHALLDVYRWLMKRMMKMRFDLSTALPMEQEVRRLTNWQTECGFMLDIEKASDLYAGCTARQAEIEDTLQKVFPPIVHKRYSDKTGKRLKDRVEEFNPGSRMQIARRLEDLGVKWRKRTEKGNIVVDETTLKEWSDKVPEAALCLEYLTVGKRQGQVRGWLKHVGDDGRIHGRVDTLGAVTSRMTHSTPNLAQVEKGGETRGCFIVPEGRRLIGVDASGLELRMLAHYMNDPDYIELVLHGDIHTYNQEAAGLDTRDQAKTFIYAFLYGAGDAKIGSIVGGGAAAGKRLKEEFLRNLPALADLKAKLNRMAEQGHVPAIDGRRLRIRHKHATLNTLLQGSGAIVMKRGLVYGANKLNENGVDWKLVAQVHDEIQAEAAKRYAKFVGDCFVEGLRHAGEFYDMRIALDGEAQIGTNWSETH